MGKNGQTMFFSQSFGGGFGGGRAQRVEINMNGPGGAQFFTSDGDGNFFNPFQKKKKRIKKLNMKMKYDN